MLKKAYLLVYNSLAALFWVAVLVHESREAIGYLRTSTAAASVYYTHSFDGYPHKLLVRVQTFNAVVEIANALTGITRSPVATVALQFFARTAITTGVCYLLPQSPGNFVFPQFPLLVLAWSLTEIIRYPFYAVSLYGEVPYFLRWLRYSAFLVLYPLGLFTEPWTIFKSFGAAKANPIHYWFFVLAFPLYIPGFVKLYGYMWRQRRKTLG